MTDPYSDGPHGTTCRPGCGQCCRVLALPYSRADAAAHPTLSARDKRWYAEELVPVTWRVAKALAPWLEPPGASFPISAGQFLGRYRSHYTCSNYDADTATCRVWASRPDTCRGFPYFGRTGLGTMNLPPSCSFRKDRGEVPDPVEQWQPVAIKEKP